MDQPDARTVDPGERLLAVAPVAIHAHERERSAFMRADNVEQAPEERDPAQGPVPVDTGCCGIPAQGMQVGAVPLP